MAPQMETIVPTSLPDRRFQKGTASAINLASRPEQRSPFLGVGYVVAILTVFVGLGLVVYFARVDKAAKEPKGAWKVPGIGACVLAVGLGVVMAFGASFSNS